MKRLFLLAIAAVLALPLQANAAEKVLKITNRRDAFPIWFIYITPAKHKDWGKDQLGGQVLDAGETRSWTIPWDGCYVDVQAKTFTGLTAEVRDVDVCGGFEWTLYDEKPKQKQQGKTLQIVNRRDAFPIWGVYITPAGQSDWGPDRLGDLVVNTGQSRTWTIPWEGCHVDVKAVTFTGLATERRGLNVCGGMVWTIYDTNPKN
jgi:hypothetical protein